MKKVWVYFLAIFEDSKGMIKLIPLFFGILLIITAQRASQLINISIPGHNDQNIVGIGFIISGFCFWGVQGLIFAVHKEFPIFLPSLKGKAAVFLGVIWAFACFAIALRAIVVNW